MLRRVKEACFSLQRLKSFAAKGPPIKLPLIYVQNKHYSTKKALVNLDVDAKTGNDEQWKTWSIDTLLKKINSERKMIGVPDFPQSAMLQTMKKLTVAPSAGDLANYTVEKLEAEGIKTSIASAIVDFVSKKTRQSRLPPTILPWQKYGQWIDKNIWIEDDNATTFANELLNTAEIELGAGVRMIKLNTWFQSEARESSFLFTRNHSRALWEEVHHYLTNKSVSNAVVTGNPGIGKSRSMIYLLRLLLKDGRLVIFESRKDNIILAFVPSSQHGQGNDYRVWVADSVLFQYSCPALANPENYFLIDPGQEPKGPVSVVAHTVLAAAPNRDHYHEFLKSPGSVKYLMPVWSEAELQAIRNYMTVNDQYLSEEQVHEQFDKFGGIPRYVYSSHKQQISVPDDTLRSALKGLQFNQLINALNNTATIELNQTALDQVPSVLFHYVFVDKEQQTQYPYLMADGYYRLEIASEYIARRIFDQYWNKVLEMGEPNSMQHSGSGALGNFFEFVSARTIANGGIFDKKRE